MTATRGQQLVKFKGKTNRVIMNLQKAPCVIREKHRDTIQKHSPTFTFLRANTQQTVTQKLGDLKHKLTPRITISEYKRTRHEHPFDSLET